MNFALAAALPAGKFNVVAHVRVGVWARTWILHSGSVYKTPFTYVLDSAKCNGEALTVVGSNPSSQGQVYADGTFLYLFPPTGKTAFNATYQAIVLLKFSNRISAQDGIQVDAQNPRIKSCPNLSQRIEPYFGGVGQIGGGSLVLYNNDGYFDDKRDGWNWNAGEVKIFLGIDTAGVNSPDGDYFQGATWSVKDWSSTSEDFTLQLVESKSRIKTKLPINVFDRDTYPNLDDSNINKRIPLVYGKVRGVQPILIDPGSKRFKIADHAIFSFDGVRIRQTVEQAYSDTISIWYLYSGNIYRSHLPNRVPKKVSDGATELEQVSSTDDVQATNDSYFYSEGWLYVNVGGSPGSIQFDYTVTAESFVTSNFDEKFESLGEFTLGNDYGVGDEVSVDLTGKTNVSTGKPIVTAPDIIKDLLTIAGDTAIDTTSFNQANVALCIGTDELGQNVYTRLISIFVDTETDLLELVGKINEAAAMYTFTNYLGQWSVRVWDSQKQAFLLVLTDVDILDFSEIFTTDKIVSDMEVGYLERKQDNDVQLVSSLRPEAQYLNNQPNPIVEDRTVQLSDEADAIQYAQRVSLMRRAPLRKLTLKLWWRGWLWNVGDNVYLEFVKRNTYGRFEVLERTVDLRSFQVTLVLSDMRGTNRAGWWWWEDVVERLPDHLAGLAGYGAGIIDWNKNWDPAIKRWSRNNYGFWTDDNSFVDATDPDSLMESAWL